MRMHYLGKHVRFLERNARGRSFDELAVLFNRRFGTHVPMGSVRSACHNRGITNGRDCRFKPGVAPHNKGQKGRCAPGSEKGWLRPGHPGYKFNERPVGSERTNKDGLVEIKVSDKKAKTAKARQKR